MAPKQYLEREREREREYGHKSTNKCLKYWMELKKPSTRKKNNTPCKKIDSLYSCPSYEVL